MQFTFEWRIKRTAFQKSTAEIKVNKILDVGIY